MRWEQDKTKHAIACAVIASVAFAITRDAELSFGIAMLVGVGKEIADAIVRKLKGQPFNLVDHAQDIVADAAGASVALLLGMIL